MSLDIQRRTFSKKAWIAQCTNLHHKNLLFHSMLKTCKFLLFLQHNDGSYQLYFAVLGPGNFTFFIKVKFKLKNCFFNMWKRLSTHCKWSLNAHKTELPGNVPSVGGAMGAVYLCKEGDYIKWVAEFKSTVVFAFYGCKHTDFKILPKIKNSATIGVVSQSKSKTTCILAKIKYKWTHVSQNTDTKKLIWQKHIKKDNYNKMTNKERN